MLIFLAFGKKKLKEWSVPSVLYKQIIDNERMASEVPTNDINALVTCRLFTFKRIFTLKNNGGF